MKNVILLFFAGFLLGCTPTPHIDYTYPFSNAAKIEVISYPSRALWDESEYGTFIDDGKLAIDTSRIKERVTLNDKQREKLFHFLFIDSCSMFSSESKCMYDPRHLILFYDVKGKLFSYFEVCLDCGMAQSGFNYNSICMDRMDNLEAIFKEAGIKYYGEGKN